MLGSQETSGGQSEVFYSHYWRCFFLVQALASLSLQVGSLTPYNHGKNNGDPNQWIRVKITPRLSKIIFYITTFSING